MTESIERAKRGEANPKLTPEQIAKLNSYPRPHEKTEFSELPAWVRAAAPMHELLGMPWEDVMEKFGKQPTAIKRYRASPAYKQWKEELEAAALDPKTMAEMTLKASTLGVTLEYLAAFEKSVSAGDFNSTAKMAQDLLDRMGVVKKQPKNDGPRSIVVNLGSATFEIPMGDSSVKEIASIPEGEFEVLDG
jgi:hypothetical protein